MFAGPGPDASLGLADNPWAAAAPGSAGIVAYFWHAPPSVLRASGPGDSGDKVLWVVHGAPGVPLTVVAHTRFAGPPVVRLTVPAALSPGGNYPSLIALPSPGCWNFDLSVGGASATLDILVAPRSS